MSESLRLHGSQPEHLRSISLHPLFVIPGWVGVETPISQKLDFCPVTTGRDTIAELILFSTYAISLKIDFGSGGLCFDNLRHESTWFQVHYLTVRQMSGHSKATGKIPSSHRQCSTTAVYMALALHLFCTGAIHPQNICEGVLQMHFKV